jgi:hypothetical protein
MKAGLSGLSVAKVWGKAAFVRTLRCVSGCCCSRYVTVCFVRDAMSW